MLCVRKTDRDMMATNALNEDKNLHNKYSMWAQMEDYFINLLSSMFMC